MKAKTYRYLFWSIWFALVPLALAVITQRLLAPADDFGPTSGMGGAVYWLLSKIKDQPLPAIIVFFTIFEAILYNYRHQLPLAALASPGDRADLPREVRSEYESAAQLLDEAERILRSQRSQIERDVPKNAREELGESLESLRKTMQRDPFDIARFEEAYERAIVLVRKHLGRWQKGELREYAESILVAVAVALLLRAFVVEAFKIPSGSMLPTLQIQDHIFVNKLAYGPTVPFTDTRLFPDLPPERGDIIVFIEPYPTMSKDPEDFIKRVIALPGDKLMVENGHPIINDWRIPNCKVGHYEYLEGTDPEPKGGELYIEYLGDYAYFTLFDEDRAGENLRQGPYRVKPGEQWVLGDNRYNSSDSRAWNGNRGGGVPDKNIKGRAMFVWLSFGNDGWLTFDRLFHNVLGTPTLPKGASPDIMAGIDRCMRNRPPRSETT
ncbi:MAG TPA: signal peptidase I, partial [Polyangiaceae bacterium]|nr:signal peptidase I [Polyangiaceae bacterium]